MSTGIFPTKLEEKNTYFNDAFTLLMNVPDRTRLGLTSVTELDDAHTLYTGQWITVFPISMNAGTSTRNHRQTRDACWKSIEKKLRLVYDQVPSLALTVSDRNTLNLKLRDTTPSDRPQIDSIPYAKLVSIGNGRLRETVRTNGDDSRASIHPDADGIETVYMLTPLDAAPPVSPAVCPLHKFSTDARFEIECSPENLGKRVYAFSRWVNTSKPEKSGPFTDVITTVVGGSGGGD